MLKTVGQLLGKGCPLAFPVVLCYSLVVSWWEEAVLLAHCLCCVIAWWSDSGKGCPLVPLPVLCVVLQPGGQLLGKSSPLAFPLVLFNSLVASCWFSACVML